MKKYTILFLIISTLLSAQKQDSKTKYKDYAGRYGGNDSICLFDDGKFMLYGYATAIFGTYNFEKDYINFYPDKQELFMIYGTQNPDLDNSSRMLFSGFEKGQNFVQFNQEKAQAVFNEDANCFDSPYVYKSNTKPSQIILSDVINEKWHQSKFLIPKEYNDLAIIYNKPSRYEENFIGNIKSDANSAVLKISMFEREFKKQKPDKDDGNWKEILEMKSEYYKSKESDKNGIFFNKHYNILKSPENSAYTFDKKSNQYISKNATENEGYFKQNQYNDDRYLRKYIKLETQTQNDISINKKDISSKSLFFTVCGEGSEKSYHYDGFTKYEDEKEEHQPLQTLEPTPNP